MEKFRSVALTSAFCLSSFAAMAECSSQFEVFQQYVPVENRSSVDEQRNSIIAQDGDLGELRFAVATYIGESIVVEAYETLTAEQAREFVAIDDYRACAAARFRASNQELPPEIAEFDLHFSTSKLAALRAKAEEVL